MSSIRAASVNFSFASPVAEDKTSDAMEGVSDPQITPEDLRHQLEDPPSLTLSHEGESVRDIPIEPSSENITITEEVLQENQDAASEETESPVMAESPGLHNQEPTPENNTTSEEVQQVYQLLLQISENSRLMRQEFRACPQNRTSGFH